MCRKKNEKAEGEKGQAAYESKPSRLTLDFSAKTLKA